MALRTHILRYVGSRLQGELTMVGFGQNERIEDRNLINTSCYIFFDSGKLKLTL